MAAQRVIRSYYAIAGLYTLSAALIWGVNTLFLLDAGLDIFAVFVANAAFTAGMFVFELPTGVLADTAGRRASFLLSVAILALTTVGYLLVPRLGGGVIAFSVISVFMGLGFTFYSGAVEAWVVDALEASGYSGQLDSVFARGSMVSGAAMLTGTLAGGVIGSFDISFPYVVRAGLLATLFVFAWSTMHDLGFTPRALRLANIPREMGKVARASVEYGWEKRSVRLLMFCSVIQYGFMAWAWYAWQPYFLELLGRDAVWVAGVIASSIAGAMIVGNACADWFSRFCGKRTTLLLWAAGIQTFAAVGVGLAGSFWLAVGLFLVMAVAMGAASPLKQAYLHSSIPSEQRASVASFDSMFGNAGGIVGQSGLGYLSRVRGIEEGYVVGGALTILVVPLVAAIRRLGEPADVIVGERASAKSSCPAQGLPEIAQVDATVSQGMRIPVGAVAQEG